MIVSAKDFHPMRGHVCEGCVVVMSDGRRFTLGHTMRGWVMRHNGFTCSPFLRTAYEVSKWVAEMEAGGC